MTVFDTAIASLFADPNLATKATYCPIRAAQREVLVIPHQPDAFQVVGESMIATPTIVVDLMLSDCPNIQAGDQFLIECKRYVIQGEPKKDSNRITARVNLCEA